MVFSCGLSNIAIIFIIIGIIIVVAFLTSGVYSDDRILALGIEDIPAFFKKVGEKNFEHMKKFSVLRFNYSRLLIEKFKSSK